MSYNMRCDWSMTFLFFGKGQMQSSFINMSANFKWLDYFLKTMQNRSCVFYSYIELLYKHKGGCLTLSLLEWPKAATLLFYSV